MNERNFSRRRRGGMRFRPSGGLGQSQRHDKEASQARADVVNEPPSAEKVYEHRHSNEIERAENIAAGLPPEGAPQPPLQTPGKRDFREPNFETPAEVKEEEKGPGSRPGASGRNEEEKPFQPVAFKEQPKGIVDTIRSAASNLVKKVQRLLKPIKKIHKEVIINAETLETRVAVLEEGKLEEFNIERTPRSGWSEASLKAGSGTWKTASKPRSWTSASKRTPSSTTGTSCRATSTAAWKSWNAT